MVQSMRDALGILLDHCRQGQGKLKKSLAEARKLDGRFSNHKGKLDVLGSMVRSRITECEQALRLEAEKEQLIGEAIAVVAQHSFRADAPQYATGTHTMVDYINAAVGVRR